MQQTLGHLRLGKTTLELPSNLESMIFSLSLMKGGLGPDSAHGVGGGQSPRKRLGAVAREEGRRSAARPH